MFKSPHPYLLAIFLIFSLFSPSKVKAQLTPDNSLGAESSIVTNPTASLKDIIDGGATIGINLFHSFKDFNIGEGREVYFTQPTGVENILTRVTGGNVSQIFGKLGVSGAANLYLINPKGIIFGPNASLDIKGSFLASTADGIKLGENGLFSATNPQDSKLLSIQPGALFVNALRNTVAEIKVNQSNLQIDSEQSLTLNSDHIKIDGGKINALRGNINITTKNLEIINGGILDVRTKNTGNAGNININTTDKVIFDNKSFANSTVDASGIGNGGNININTKSLFVTNGSQLDASTKGQGNAGNININATDIVSFKDPKDGLSGAFTTVGGNGYVNNAQVVGNGGDINIKTGSLSLSNISILNASTFGKGNSGNININATDKVSFDFSFAVTSINPGAVGNGGDINIKAHSVDFVNNSQLFLNVNNEQRSINPGGSRNAGNVNISATDKVFFDNSAINNFISPLGIGNAGNININASSLFLTNKSQFISSTEGKGNGGKINITANNTVSFDNSSIASTIVAQNAEGNAGDINIKTGSLFLTNKAQLINSTKGKGNAGMINIRANDTVSLKDGSFANNIVAENAVGNAGDINIKTGSLFLTNKAQLINSTEGKGNAGMININANDTVSLKDGSFANNIVAKNAVGNGGVTSIITASLFLRNGSQLNSSTSGQGNAGKVNIYATDTISFDGVNSEGTASGAFSAVDTFAIGKGSEININTKLFTITNGAELITSTKGKGDGGQINIIATDKVLFDGVDSKGKPTTISTGVDSSAIGNGGDININTNSFGFTNSAELISSTSGKGNAGNLNINAQDIVYFDKSFARTTVDNSAIGSGGQIKLDADTFSITNDSEISASTFGKGQAGSIIVAANTFEATSGGQLVTNTSSSFNAGDINILSPKSMILSGEKTGLFANSENSGTAGNITINTPNLIVSNSASISASTNQDGLGGNIIVMGNSLTANNGAQFLTTTYGTAKAGNINLNIRDHITLDGTNTGLFANTEKGSIGDSGNITIDPEIFIIKNGAEIAVNSQGNGKGGNISIQAGTLTLDNKAFINAATANSQGGEISLEIKNLLFMRHNSNITATAGTDQAGGNGGNININAPLIVAVPYENNDIIANAYQGNGGNINITTNQIFGLKFQPQLTEFSDITASSQFGLTGQVTISRLDVNPSTGLASLPVNLLNAYNHIDQGCKRGRLARQKNRFSVVGKGGLPSNPHDVFTSMSPLVDLVEVNTMKVSQKEVIPVIINNPNNRKVNLKNREIQQAQGWVFNHDGQVILTVETPRFKPHSEGFTYPTYSSCYTSFWSLD